MNEILDKLINGTVVTGGAIAAAIIGISAYLPKLLNGIKSDKIEGNVLDRIKRHEERMDEMDETIHKQQVHNTRFEVLVIHLVGLLAANGITIPDSLQREIDDLTGDSK